ncbi:hypothetical protein HJB84_16260 [Rhizobium sp. NZLR1b]|uniref:hypothetical protein n=1 Tax=Rhizobium sp. NZLR1b TaxID=2731099 RepID=UPI001C838A99|nr:hypothetical protein [Rhizobium sp. NZLR1b]MBX5171396.1 hypothetical protein [Rhizobium sp. NZLR1b]
MTQEEVPQIIEIKRRWWRLMEDDERPLEARNPHMDLTALFLFLRRSAPRNGWIREAGDMIAHRWDKDAGLVLTRLKSSLEIMDLYMQACDGPLDKKQAQKAAEKLLGFYQTQGSDVLGISYDKARSLIDSIKQKLSGCSIEGFQFQRPLKDSDSNFMRRLWQVGVKSEILTPTILLEEFSEALLASEFNRHLFDDEKQRAGRLLNVFVASQLHNLRLKINGRDCVLKGGYFHPKAFPEVQVYAMYTDIWGILRLLPVMHTGLTFENICSPSLVIDQPIRVWRGFAVEIGLGEKLHYV